MKLVAIVGSESHTSSWASLTVEYVKDGYWTQTPKEWKRGMTRASEKYNSNWWLIELDVPVGTKIRYKGKSVGKKEFQLIFVMDESAEVVEETPTPLALIDGMIKGRMRRLATPAPKPVVDTASGF